VNFGAVAMLKSEILLPYLAVEPLAHLLTLQTQRLQLPHVFVTALSPSLCILDQPPKVIIKPLIRLSSEENFDNGSGEVGQWVENLFFTAESNQLDSSHHEVVVLDLLSKLPVQRLMSLAEPLPDPRQKGLIFLWKKGISL